MASREFVRLVRQAYREMPPHVINVLDNIDVVVDRIVVREGLETRLADSFRTALDLADDRGDAVDEVDHDAVLGDHHVLDAGGACQVGVGEHVPDLAVHRQHVARLDDVVAVEELAAGGVTGDVDARLLVGDHTGADLGQ